MPFAIEIAASALAELNAMKAYYRRQIAHAVEHQLPHQPLVETKNRKLLGSVETSFESEPPIWELRVGSYRIFYDVDEAAKIVFVRAIREKPPGATTEEIL